MIISFFVAVYFQFGHVALGFDAVDPSLQLVLGVVITSIGWMTVTMLTPPADAETLASFHSLIRPMGNGWAGAGLGLSEEDRSADSPAAAFLAWFLGITVVYGAVLGTGYVLYGRALLAVLCLGAAAIASFALLKTLPRVGLT